MCYSQPAVSYMSVSYLQGLTVSNRIQNYVPHFMPFSDSVRVSSAS